MAASGFTSFLEGFRDLVWGVRWLLAPACMFTVLLVIANAINISVRERRLELAVLKVLRFRPAHIFDIWAAGLLLTLLVGLAGGLIPSIHDMRLRALEALRSGERRSASRVATPRWHPQGGACPLAILVAADL